jgi:hypothetical protein
VLRFGFFASLFLAAYPAVAISSKPPLPAPVLRVGDPSVDAARIQPHERHWKVTLATIQNRIVEFGDWKETVTRGEVSGRPTLERRIALDSPDGKPKERVLLVVDAKTFAPVRTEEERPDLGTHLRYTFDGRRLRGERSPLSPGEPPRHIDVRLEVECFDYLGGMMELFFASLPLKEGYAVTFPAALATSDPVAAQDGIAWITARVKGKASVEAWGRKFDTQVVEAETPYGFYKVWLSPESPYVIQAVLLIGPGGRFSYLPA